MRRLLIRPGAIGDLIVSLPALECLKAEYLEVWNHDRFLTKLQREPFTDDDARALAEHGI